MASIYKRNNMYYIKFYENGTRVRRSLNTSNKNSALRLKEQIERELATGQFVVERKDSPVDIFWREYRAWAVARKRPTTVATEEVFWKQFMAFRKPQQLGDVIPRDIERFKAKRLRDGLKPQSVNDALRHLQAIYNYARKLGYYSGANPVQGIQRLKIEKNPPKFLQKDEIDLILDIATAHGRDIHLVFALGIYAGLRKNEIVNARWEWFDFEHKLVTLSTHEGFHLKNSETRTIPFHDRLSSILSPYREDNGFVFMPKKKSRANTGIAMSSNGRLRLL